LKLVKELIEYFSQLSLSKIITKIIFIVYLDENCFIRLCKSQILSLVIVIQNCDEEINSIKATNQFIFTQIFTMFHNLQCLNFSSSHCQQLRFLIPHPIVFSSTLLELHVRCTAIEIVFIYLIIVSINFISSALRLNVPGIFFIQ
jgi:hypothetical protein